MPEDSEGYHRSVFPDRMAAELREGVAVVGGRLVLRNSVVQPATRGLEPVRPGGLPHQVRHAHTTSGAGEITKYWVDHKRQVRSPVYWRDHQVLDWLASHDCSQVTR